MAARKLGTQGADMNVDVICIFHRGEVGFNGVSSIKTDIYFVLGCVLLAASSILRYVADVLAGLTYRRSDRHFKTNHRLRLELIFPSCPLMDRQIHGPGSFSS